MIKNTVFLLLLVQFIQPQLAEKISETKCKEYSSQCKTERHTVDSAETAEPGEFPHMAVLGWPSRKGSGYDWSCGGSLISENYVLTAAHCFLSRRGEPSIVRLGEHNLKDNNEVPKPQDIQISKIIIQPEYNNSNIYNDIALIQLKNPASFNDRVRPACLWQKQSLPVDGAVANGWGRNIATRELSDIIKKIYLPIVDNAACEIAFKSNRRIRMGIIEKQLCAGGEAGKDTCFGDGGGPLHFLDSANHCSYHQIGIVSTGSSPCGKKGMPGIYTRISSYIDWIESIVWPQ